MRSKPFVQYSVDLGNKPHIEHIKLFKHGRHVGGVLYRLGEPVCWFYPSLGQAKKIQSGQGKLNITTKMLNDAAAASFSEHCGDAVYRIGRQ